MCRFPKLYYYMPNSMSTWIFVKRGRWKDKGKVEREKKGDLAVLVGARWEEKEKRETKRVRCHISLLTMPKEELFRSLDPQVGWHHKILSITNSVSLNNLILEMTANNRRKMCILAMSKWQLQNNEVHTNLFFTDLLFYQSIYHKWRRRFWKQFHTIHILGLQVQISEKLKSTQDKHRMQYPTRKIFIESNSFNRN